MKKKILMPVLCMILALGTVFVLSSCGSEDKSTSEEGKDGKTAKVAEVGFNLADGKINYAIKVDNPKKDTEYAVAVVKVTGESKDGKEVFTTQQDVSLFPGDNYFVGNEAGDKANQVAKVKAEITISKEDNIKEVTTLKKMFKIDQVKEDKDSDVVTGQIAPLFTPNSNNPTGSAIVLLFDKDKKLVGGQACLINLVGKDKPVEFKVDLGKIPHESFEVVGYTSTYETNEDE